MTGEKASKKSLFSCSSFWCWECGSLTSPSSTTGSFLGRRPSTTRRSSPSTSWKAEGVRTYKEPPPVVESADPSRLIDPERYVPPSEETVPYIKEVTGYAGFLALVWKITGTKLWIYPQAMQVLFEMLVALGLYLLALKSFGRKAAFWTALGFAFLCLRGAVECRTL